MSAEHHLEKIVVEPKVPANAAVIWLHGLGADGHDFESIVHAINLPAELAIRFIFPHANMRPITMNNNYVMRAWYDINAMDLTFREDEKGIRESAKKIEHLIAEQVQAGISPHRIVLAGFSQGGAMALFSGLRYSQTLGGIIALSTYVPLISTTKIEALPTNLSIPIFMAHGLHDGVVPFSIGEISKNLLENLGYPMEFHSYPIQHSVCMEEIVDIRNWLVKVLNSTHPLTNFA